MQKLCIFVAMALFSYLGWQLGGKIGEIMTAFFLSGVFAAFGVWAGWSIHRRFLD